MAKRLTDSNKWQDSWFMDLPSKYKLFWLYLLDNCDHAGIWKVNFKVASFHIGEDINQSELQKILVDRIIIISENYWQVKKFIDFQYGGIKNDAVGKSVQKILKSHNLEFNIAPKKGHDSPIDGTKDIYKDKDKVISKEFNNLKDEIFKDEIFMESLKMTHQGKDFNQAWNECYLHHSNAPNPPILLWQWKQKFNTWLTIKTTNEKPKSKFISKPKI